MLHSRANTYAQPSGDLLPAEPLASEPGNFRRIDMHSRPSQLLPLGLGQEMQHYER